MVMSQEDLKIYFKEKNSTCSSYPSERYCQLVIFSEHTLDLCQALNPLNILSGTIYFNDQNMISLISLLGRQLKSLT